MTVRVLALVADVMGPGASRLSALDSIRVAGTVPGGLLRDRFIPRLRAAEPGLLVQDTGEKLRSGSSVRRRNGK
jgi:hypothetical protein